MDTTDKRPLSGGQEDHYERRGLGPWLGRNRWLLTRLFTVIVFSFAASTVAANFSYGLEGKPTILSVEQLNSGRLPAGTELGEMVNAVIRQLEFENLTFDVVMTGSMFDGGTMLIEPMRATIHKLAPKARLVRLSSPPVVGAVILGMEADAYQASPEIRMTIKETISVVRNVSVR